MKKKIKPKPRRIKVIFAGTNDIQRLPDGSYMQTKTDLLRGSVEKRRIVCDGDSMTRNFL